jgi:hypothetical protein
LVEFFKNEKGARWGSSLVWVALVASTQHLFSEKTGPHLLRASLIINTLRMFFAV